ncbi:MAG: hypothetical protein JNL92_01215, partial [Opitutaceae bacterium]|nr:hypothetical protein [Opitutaceae bacterium]
LPGILSPLASRLSPRASRAGGFALLIVITLLAFIVLLLLGLAVFARIEGAVAGNTQRQAQARENALLALNVAVGQLQRYAGPDTRVSATAANFGGVDGTRHYTGIWNSDASATSTPSVPLTWLVSGNELTQEDTDPAAAPGSRIAAPLAVKPDAPGTRTVDLIGRNATGSATRNADYVVAPLTDITATGIPGAPPAAATTIGRYAWWVGDQGVKAPVAQPDPHGAATFAPYDSADLRRRIRQQVPLGAGAAEGASGAPIFEPADANNAALVANQKVNAFSQLAFLRTTANAQVGLARLRQNLHTWSPNNYAVLANTKNGGLRQDLSLNPAALGTAFAAWTDYATYMEPLVPDPNAPPSLAPPITPAYGTDPIRRRYIMTPHLIADGGSHQVGPVLSQFFITFNVRTEGGSAGVRPLEVRAGWMLSLWNPYTSALVPEELRVEVRGLPEQVTVMNDMPARLGPVGSFVLQPPANSPGPAVMDNPLQINLPWDAANVPTGSPAEDRQSWLPGRVYTWRSLEDLNAASPAPATGFASRFYSRNFGDAGPNQGVQRAIPSAPVVDGDDLCHLDVIGNDQLEITLWAVRATGDVRLGRFVSPSFVSAFSTTSREIKSGTYQFGYEFRLTESLDVPATPSAWLTTDGRDVRRRTVPPEAFIVGSVGNSPELYENTFSLAISKPDRLLDRASDSWSYNEDVPLFELPRAPLLSLGALQHFRIPGRRPFMIGNSWGAAEQLNNVPLGSIFDRFFFSGLVSGVVPDATATGDLILPNPLLKPLRKPDQSKVTITDIRDLVNPPTVVDANGNVIPGPAPSSASSKYFLQSGAFNVNSPHRAAWVAVLRGVRFPAPQSFTYLDTDETTGTADDALQASVQSADAQFFRFPQSAQETYKAEKDKADNDPNTISLARTELFRRGMRTLSGSEVSALAGRSVELLAVKHQAPDPEGGPFRSLEEFLAPSLLFAGVDANGNVGAPRSLLEAAIEDAGINAAIPEFSSQWLTQADVMTSLAPVLFPRSDTFVIRTYGEAVNPATNAVEGRAWAEAIVQRLPEYFADPAANPPETDAAAFDVLIDPADPASGTTQTQQLNKAFGRRFKVVSFRWLTRADI